MLCSKCGNYQAAIIDGGEQLCYLCAFQSGNEQIKAKLSDADFLQEALTALAEQKTAGRYQSDGCRSQVFNSGRGEEREHRAENLLQTVCRNLTEAAAHAKLDPVVGRRAETNRLLHILCRRSKNNPCLIGEAGVGKTAIVEGLCQKIAAKAVPTELMQKQIFELDLSALVAGTQYRGQFEARMKQLLSEIKLRGDIILYIDEIHTIIGTGGNEASMNVANIIKPAISRGELQIIGSTTLSEYRRSIEKDGALERRFQSIVVEEPSLSEAAEILKGSRERFEDYHGVAIDDETIDFAVFLADRYITDRCLPDKAVDLLDEACVIAKLSDTGLQTIAAMRKEQLEIDEAIRYSRANPHADSNQDICSMIRMKESGEREIEAVLKASSRPKLKPDHLAKVIEEWTKIPAGRVSRSEGERLQGLGARLRERIVNQDAAVEVICDGLKRHRAGISPKRKPVSMIFAGPTGVGKTELAKQLALDLFDSAESIIRFDMSEFMEKHTVSRLIGAPPGYLGYDEAGQLTEKIRRKPYAVVLFDEIEKAHPDVLNILLQILDDGRVSDAHGRVVNFENCVVIMTTNAGFGNKGEGANNLSEVIEALYRYLRPEFINRVDDIILFNRLRPDDLQKIALIMLKDIKTAAAAAGVGLRIDDQVAQVLAAQAFSEAFGARELRRVIQRQVENPLAHIMLANAKKALAVSVGEDGKIKVK
ncbi:MAG: ATP-dependent Clp protease ATP-binding subunit [Clostridia bacterium]|nr:ATP-dependent Clp protease ATP-binding subunit [Clostridia bacterium]MDD4798670.1 ATP-dependent Clp protease ATP-binding subunit [Clostridia bacterium]